MAEISAQATVIVNTVFAGATDVIYQRMKTSAKILSVFSFVWQPQVAQNGHGYICHSAVVVNSGSVDYVDVIFAILHRVMVVIYISAMASPANKIPSAIAN